jgi:hypothetical protein
MPDIDSRLLAVQDCFCLHTAGTNAQTVAVCYCSLVPRQVDQRLPFVHRTTNENGT